jgi:hypothetical protein
LEKVQTIRNKASLCRTVTAAWKFAGSGVGIDLVRVGLQFPRGTLTIHCCFHRNVERGCVCGMTLPCRSAPMVAAHVRTVLRRRCGRAPFAFLGGRLQTGRRKHRRSLVPTFRWSGHRRCGGRFVPLVRLTLQL